MPRVPRRMYTEAEARAVIKRELLLRRTNDSEPIEKRKEDGDEDLANSQDGLTISKDGFQKETKKICYLLEKLPFEVRTLIYRIPFRRPTAIAPSDIRYKFGKKPTLSIYSYQWNNLRQDGHGESFLPKYDGSHADVNVAWRSKATLEQSRAIGAGKYKKCASTGERELSHTTYKEDIDAKVKHYVYQAGDSPAQVVNRAVVSVTGIQGVALLGTCKQLLEECRVVLYGENTFAFNTCGPRGQVPYKDSLGLHAYDAFQDRPHEIPGLKTIQTKRSGGMTQGRINHAINIMFDKDTTHQPQPFMARDPLIKFFRNIGPSSASHVTSVILEGHFRTADNTRKSRQRPISFRRTLPIHSTILKNVCPKLRKLVLSQAYVDPFTALFDDVRDRRLKLTFEGRVDLVVGQVLAALPTLQVLQLGNPHPAPSCESAVAVALWGRSLRWEGVVESRYQRAEEFAEEERKKSGRRKKQRKI
ncbi:hypothetical protein BKA61DRAFT_700372 [Leptodontidium sp. MPI-SDFR-AT-0119]|nr:hypothetical protein BKA61DRAFT_700372 [Leptodontidium sp. MPI-SDFR-AT-0119]